MCSVTAVRDSSSARTRQVAHRVQGNEMAATGLRALKKQTHIDVLPLQLILTAGRPVAASPPPRAHRRREHGHRRATAPKVGPDQVTRSPGSKSCFVCWVINARTHNLHPHCNAVAACVCYTRKAWGGLADWSITHVLATLVTLTSHVGTCG